MLNYELTIPLGYSGDKSYDERNLQSNDTPENEVTCTFYMLNTWIWSQLRGKNKTMVYTVTHNHLPRHHFNFMVEAHCQLYKRIWNTRLEGRGVVAACFPSLLLFRGISAFYLQTEAIRSYNHFSKVREQQHPAESSSLPLSCFYPPLYVLMVYYHSLNHRWWLVFFLSSSEKDLKHQSITKRQS